MKNEKYGEKHAGLQQQVIAGSPVKKRVYRAEDQDKNTFVICFLKLVKEYYLTAHFHATL